MSKLDDVPIAALEAALEEATGSRETQRLMVAILYKRGPSVPMIAEWFDMRQRTIYDWLDRLESRPIEEAVTDDRRLGRPPKLEDSAREYFEDAVSRPPSESGYEHAAWTTQLAQRFLVERFAVEYSRRHIRRLLAAADADHESPGDAST